MRQTVWSEQPGMPRDLTNYGRLFAAQERGDPVRVRLIDGRCCCGRIADLAVDVVRGNLVGRVDVETSPLSLEQLDFAAIVVVAALEFPVPALGPSPRLRN